MQYHSQSRTPIRIWRIESKPGYRQRVLDFLKHIFILAIILIILSAAQTAMAVEPVTGVTRHGDLCCRARWVQSFTDGNNRWVKGFHVFPWFGNVAADPVRLRVGERAAWRV